MRFADYLVVYEKKVEMKDDSKTFYLTRKWGSHWKQQFQLWGEILKGVVD